MNANLTAQISPSAAKTERAKLRRQRVTRTVTENCTRCGGAGGASKWQFTGWTCFQCVGSGTKTADRRVYTDDALAARDEMLTSIIDADAARIAQDKYAAEMAPRLAAAYDAAFDAAQIAVAALDAQAQQTYLGEIGTKIAATGTVLCAITIEGFYGSSRLIIVETADGNQIKTFGTGATLYSVERDDEVTISGTVKSHEMYEGDRQTVLTRTKIAAA